MSFPRSRTLPFDAGVNPEIVRREGEQLFREGCLSIPEYTGNVRRAARITVRARDMRGEPLVPP